MRKQKYLNFLENEMFRIMINTILVIYIIYVVYRTPLRFLMILDTPIMKIVVLAVILLLFCRAPDTSLFVAIAYFVSIQALQARMQALEGFTNGEKLTIVRIQDDGSILVKSKDGNLLEITKDVIPFCNLDDPKNLLKKETPKAEPEPEQESKPEEKPEEKPKEKFEEKKKDQEVPLNQPEIEMIAQLKEIDAIPRDVVVKSRIAGNDQERHYKVEVLQNGVSKNAILIVKNDAMPEIKVVENFRGSPIDENTPYMPQTGCFNVPVKGTPLSNPCNAVITFKNELNAQGLEQNGPFGYDGSVLGAAVF